jgi:tetratricopeptide (TPR) repeat protein
VPLQLPTLSIFVSSTWHDLWPERSAVIEVLNRLRLMKFVGMEYSGAWSEPPLVPSLKEARECDAYVGIFGGRYGSGITAKEYGTARSEHRKCFIYFKDESSATLEVDAEPEKREQLQALKAELRKNHTWEVFTSPEDLARKVTTDLSNWYAREFLGPWADDVRRQRMPGFAPFQLPPPPDDFVGRRHEIELLTKALEPSEQTRIAGVSGMGGVGKTALALHVADKLRDDYPHAQLFVKLNSMRYEPLDLLDALKQCIKELGGELGEGRTGLPDSLDVLSKLYRHNLNERRALIILDDAANESQLRAFMPPPGCALLVTSRKKLFMPGIANVGLTSLSASESCDLLMSIASRIAADEAEQIASLCGYLPLALLAAGSLLYVTDDLEPVAYVQQLRDENTRLKALDRKTGILDIGVEATFNISYEHLGSEARRTFRHLAVFPATFDKKAQEAICGDGSGERLSNLVGLSLVSFDSRTSRYSLHDLYRLYAAQLLLPHERQTGGWLHASHYLDVARMIGELYEREATARDGLELFDTEWVNLQAGRAWASEHSAGNNEAALSCLHYADALKHLLYLRRHPQEQIKWMKSALAASRQLRQRVSEGRYLCHLGTAYSLTKPSRAVECYRQAIDIAHETEDQIGKGNALGGLGNTYTSLGQDGLAIEYYKQCLFHLYNLSDGRGAGRTLTNLGNIYANRGESRHAVEFYRQALEVAREMRDRRGEAIALCNLGNEEADSGENLVAARHYQQALSLMRETDDLRGQAATLTGLGNTHSALDEHTQAFEYYRKALQISREVGDSDGEGVALSSMGNAHAALDQFDEAVKCHKQALAISRESGERRSEAQDLTNLGNAYYLSGDIRTALKYHSEALTISREIGSDLDEGIALWNIAQAHDKSNETGTAEIYAADAFEILEQLRHPLAEAIHKFLTRSSG